MGLRFSLAGSNYEVVFVHGAVVRYSAKVGGKIYKMALEKFNEKFSLGEIQFDINATECLLSEIKTQILMRKQAYIKNTIVDVKHLYSKSEVRTVIRKTAKQINDLNPPVPRTVMRWVEVYLDAGKDLYALNKFRVGNKFLRFPIEVEELIQKSIQELFLAKQEIVTCEDVYDDVKNTMANKGIDLNLCPTLRTIQRRIAILDPYVVLRAKQGTRAANNALKAAGEKIISPFFMSLVEIDTHTLDIFIIESESKQVLGRPFLTCAIDVHTRCIVGYYLCMLPANATKTLAVLKQMLLRAHQGLPGGLPSLIIPDNGVEFKNTTFSRVCKDLGITIQPAQNRNPNNKPYIERFFGTLAGSLIHKIKGTTFSNPQTRGDYDSQKNASITLENLRSYIDDWIHDVYHKSMNSDFGSIPQTAWSNAIKLAPPRLISLFHIEIIVRKAMTKTINHGQVGFLDLKYKAHSLATLKAKGISKVNVMVDETNLEHVFIEDPFNAGNYIQADSTTPDYTKNLTLYEHQMIRLERKEFLNDERKKLGEHELSFARWRLYQRIQSDIKLNNKKAKQLKNDLPQRFKDLLGEPIDLSVDFKELKTIDDLPVISSSSDENIDNGIIEIDKNNKTLLIFNNLEFDNE
ncbi:transposase [Acinetobacter baumannii]|nr:integrase core domain protein [Acinetobacter baumannii WC-348]OTT85919.1 transposase [Acinetobacter baumannii]